VSVVRSGALACTPPPPIFVDGFESGDTGNWSGEAG